MCKLCLIIDKGEGHEDVGLILVKILYTPPINIELSLRSMTFFLLLGKVPPSCRAFPMR